MVFYKTIINGGSNMAVKGKVATVAKKVKKYNKEYIQNIQFPSDSKPLTLSFEQLADKLWNNKRSNTVISEDSVYTEAPTGFWKHNLPEGAVFRVQDNGFVINRY